MGRATIEIRIPLDPAIDFGNGPESIYALDWQIPDRVSSRDRFVPPSRRHRPIRDALARLMDTSRFRFSDPVEYQTSSTHQAGHHRQGMRRAA